MAKLQGRYRAMKPNDLIYDAVYKGCLKAGCSERLSKDAAVSTLTKYKNGQFKTTKLLIDGALSEAKKMMKIERRKKK